MIRKKIIFDVCFILFATIILTILIDSELTENFLGFALIPILLSYYLGQLVERKTRTIN